MQSPAYAPTARLAPQFAAQYSQSANLEELQRQAAAGLVQAGAGLMQTNAGLVHTGAGLMQTGAGLVQGGAGLVPAGGGLMQTGGGLVQTGVNLVQGNTPSVVGSPSPVDQVSLKPEPIQHQPGVAVSHPEAGGDQLLVGTLA